MLENTEGAIKHGQSRETGNIGVHKKINKTKTQYNMCWHHYTKTSINNVNNT